MPDRSASTRGALILCAASVLATLALRWLYLVEPWRIDWTEFPRFLNDEGILGIMARHILRGARPVFYYGQYYMGASEAYFAATMFSLFGESLRSLRAIPSIVEVTWIPLAFLNARKLYGTRAGLLAATLVALPSKFVFEWGAKALASFTEPVALVLLMLYLVLLLCERVTRLRLIGLGLAAGFSVWNNQLTIPYLGIFAGGLWLWSSLGRREVVVLALATALGASPLIYGNIVQPLCTVRALAAKVRTTYRLSTAYAKDDDDSRPPEYRAVALFQVVGVQHGSDGAWSPLGTLGALLLAMGCVGGVRECLRARARDPARFHRLAIVLACVAISVGVGISGFSGQPVGRYQLVLYPLLSLIAAGWVEQALPRYAVAIVAGIALLQAIHIALPVPPDGHTPRDTIVRELQERGLRYGYAAGSVYDLVFESREDVILVPLDRSRYLPYEAAVARADSIFYLYRSDQEGKVAHRVFMRHLQQAGVRYGRFDVGDYHVLYDLAPRDAVSATAIATIRDQFFTERGRPRS